MNIANSSELPRYPKAVPISRQAWDAKLAESRRAQAEEDAKRGWLEKKADSYFEWRDRQDWDKIDQAAMLGPGLGVGAAVAAMTVGQSGLGPALMLAGGAGLAAGVVGRLASHFLGPPHVIDPRYDYREPLFLV